MLTLIRCLLLSFILIAPGFSHAAEEPFFHEGVARDAAAYEKFLKSKWSTEGQDHEGWRRKGLDAMTAGDPRQATSAFAAAVVLQPDDTASWLDLARAFLAVKPKASNERYRLPQNASSAAYIAFKRSKADENRAEALAVLANALTRRSYWRPALNAYKASLAVHEVTAVRTAYGKLRNQHGFRILDYRVDSDTATPRVCVQFSETLAKGRIDFGSYIKLDGKDPAGVTKENRQLCVAGLSHGKRYEIGVREGVPSTVGEVLQKSVQLIVYVRDRKPSVRFTGRNYVLPRTGQNGIPLVSVNTKSVSIKIYRVGDRSLINAVVGGNFSRQISAYEAERLGNTLGTRIWSGEMPVNQVLNEEVTTAIPVQDALPKIEPGLYAMVATSGGSKSENWKAQATQWFIVSDIGLTAFTARDGIHGFVRSLASAEPMKDVELRLLARNNEVLEKVRTDTDGHALFSGGLVRGKGGLAPALLIAQDKAGDYAFVDLTRSSFDLTDRGVGGRAAPGPLDAYVFTERGVYRPGEQVHLTALIRDARGAGVPGLPATMVLTRPDGVEHARTQLPDGGYGGHSQSIPLSASAMTGTWRAALYADPKGSPIGSVSFLVEDFVPQRLELTVNAETKIAVSGGTADLLLKGRYLYGAPAAHLAIEGNVTIKPSLVDLEGFSGYRFGLEDEDFTPIRRPLLDLPRTGADGTAHLKAVLPTVQASTRLMQASFNIRLREPGGRTVEKSLSLPVKSLTPLLGLKPLFKDGHVENGGTASFALVAIGPDAKPIDLTGLKWELLKVERRFQWYSRNGAWNYESMTFTHRVANGTIEAKAGKPASISAEVEWGRYRLEVTSADPNGPAVSQTFTAGWYAAESADTPDILDIAFDSQDYAAGDTVSVKLTPRVAGKAQIAVITDRIVALKTVDVPEGGMDVALKATEDWAPGAYVTAMFYRPMDQAARRMPSRSIGVKWLKLKQRKRLIGIAMDVDERVRPKQPLTVPVTLTGLTPGTDARLVVAAVDVGILNLTRYKPPEPEKWYYGQRRLGAEIRDVYGRLIDGMQAVRGRVRSGGDGGGALQGPPPSQKPVALFSGLVTVGNDGKAEVTFDVPAFDGTLRLMAVAWNGNQLGHAVKDVVVRDNIVLVGTAPRFLSSGDQSQLHLSFDNVEGPAGSYTLAVRPQGPLTATKAATEQTFDLKAKQRMDIAIPLTAKGHGSGEIEVVLRGPENFELTRSYTVPVYPAEPNVTRRFVHSLPENGGTLTLSQDILGNLDPKSVKISVNAGQNRALDVPGLLLALDRYPYGCAEQTTSRALPLLYLSSVAEGAGLAGEANAKTRIQKAIDRLRGMQNGSGGFGFWSPSGQDLWLTSYVADFLTRAGEQGYDVGRTLDQALNRLRNFANYAPDFTSGGENIAYAHYVLARNGRAGIGDLRYYVDTKLKNFTTPLARAQLGAALALYGDKVRAETAFRSAVSALEGTNTDISRRDYGSPLRDGAAALTLVSETSFGQSTVKSLSDVIDRLSEKRGFTSTQENAWLLLAANALQKRQSELVFSVNGKTVNGTVSKVLTASDLQGGSLFTVRNDNASAMTAMVTVSGAALTPEPPISKGFRITRNVYTLDGKPASLESVKQNQRFVVVVKVEEIETKRGRLLVADRLPAGFEIENPRLVDSASLKSFSWLRSTTRPEHTEFRDDKFVAAFNLTRRGAKQPPARLSAAYMIRAVSPGTYLHPAATVEDMYRPERLARTAAGKSEILASHR